MREMESVTMRRFAAFALSALLLVLACNVGGGTTVSEEGGDQPEEAVEPASASGRAWLDADEDGYQDEGELGVPEVEVELQSTDLVHGAVTQTDQQGAFTFGDVAPGQYFLVFDPGQGFQFSPMDQGQDDTSDSDADASGQTDSFPIRPGEQVENMDAGLVEGAPELQPSVEPEATATDLILIPNGEYQVRAMFSNGSGDCMASPTDYSVPNLIFRVEGDQLEIEQPGMHLNTGQIDQSDGTFDASEGTGPDTEAYEGQLSADMSGGGNYRYTTSSGTCTWDFTLEQVP